MGGKRSGNKPIYDDKFHRAQRELMRPRQLKYDREIAAIRKEKKCSFHEAQRIRRKARLEAELEKLGDAK